MKEINAAGGMLGKKIDYQAADTQTQPGVAKALAAKAVDRAFPSSSARCSPVRSS